MADLRIGIQKDWRKRLIKSLLYASVFIGLNFLFPQFTIGFPYDKPASFASDAVIVVFAAPLVEESIFRLLLLNTAFLLRLPTFLAVLGTAGLFSLFHYTAYGGSLTAQGATFFGAFIFGVAAAIIAIRQKGIVETIIIHATFNAWILARLYQVI